MSQQSYSLDLTQSIAGGIAQGLSNEVQTRKIPSGGDSVGYGLAVEFKTGGDDHVKPYVGGKVSGVIVRDLASEVSDGLYAEPSEVPVLTNGVIWVPVDGDVTPSDPVFVRSAIEPEVFTVTWDGDFVVGNLVSANVGGVSVESLLHFDTDQATTIANVAAAIALLSNVATAVVTGAREITITGAEDSVALAATSAFGVSLGASQASDTIAVVTGPTSGADLGAFRADDDDVGNGATAVALTSANFMTSASAGGLAALRINLP